MDFYLHLDYKAAIRERLREFRQLRKDLSLKKIAARLPVQYTYLSKALNDEKTHLNEDHLFAICHFLELSPEETDFLFLLRGLAIASSLGRRRHLEAKVAAIQRSRQIHATVQDFHGEEWNKEADYLLDSIAVVVHVSLHIPEYAQNPRKLCAPLGILPKRLQEVLDKLHRNGFIELASNGVVEKLNKIHIHYNPDHPLMRTHQSLLKALCASQLLRIAESDKLSFMVTFSADEQSREQIRQAFERFIGQVEKIAMGARQQNTFQLNFELFKWL